MVELAAYDRLPWFTLRVLVIGVVGSVVAAAATLRRRRSIEIGAIAGTLAVVAAVGLTAITFDARAFLSPTYTGSLSLAPELFGPVEATLQRVDHFRSELRKLVAGASRAYAAVEANPLGAGDEVRVLHISDIHLSTIGYDFAIELAKSFDVDLVIDTGDTSSFGTEAEAAILSAVPRFQRPYVYVRGNHDSLAFEQAVGLIEGATVLDGRVVTVAGLDVYGLGDPYFVGRRGTPVADEEVADLVRSVGPRFRDDVVALPRPPDIVAVHDQRMAEAAAGYVPLVVSGHFHRAAAAVSEGTIFLQVGTTGGAGPTGVTAEGDQPLSAEILYFRPTGEGQRLVAWDLVTQSPDSGTLEIRRHLVEEELGSPTPSPPAPTGAELTGATGVP
jgi:predicted phosphodiesterase